MSLLWVEGFENRQHATFIDRLYASTGGTFPSFPAGRRIGSSMRGSTYAMRSPALVASVENTWTIGFGLKISVISSTHYPIMALFSGATEQLRVEFQAGTTSGSAVAVVKRGSTTLATSTAFLLGPWNYFEFQAVVRTGSNGSYELKMNGASLVSGATTNTADTGVDGADAFRLDCGGASTFSNWDDIYVRNDTTYLGPQVVLGALPNGDGASLNFIPSSGSTHYDKVDDPATNPSDTDDNSSNVDGDVDLYDFANLTQLASTTTVNGVAVTCDVRMRSSGGRTVAPRYRDPSTSTGDFASFDVTSRSFIEKQKCLDENPVTASPWTKTDIDSGQFGLFNDTEV